MESAFNIKNIAAYIVFAIFFVLDRVFKGLALNSTTDTNIIGEIVKFSFSKNFNIAFSLPVGGPNFALILTVIVILLVAYFIYLIIKKYPSALYLPLLLIILGAISNVADRWMFGFIIDYLDVYNFTVLNVADIMISLGAIWLLFTSFKMKKPLTIS